MREIAKRTIDDAEYEFNQFGVKQSLRILVKLSKIVGKPIVLAADSLKKEGKGAAFDFKTLAVAAGALFENIEEDEALTLIEQLTSGDACLCDGKKVQFDAHYRGRLNHLFNVLIAALEVQYGNFLEEFLGKLPLEKSQHQAEVSAEAQT
jgi:hypothetical protein